MAADTGIDPKSALRSEALREHIYVSFTTLAVTMALERDVAHVTAGGAALAIGLTIVGTLLAASVAELIAHMVVDEVPPTRTNVLHLLRVAAGSLVIAVLPIIILALAASDVISVEAALRTIAIVLMGTLVVATFIAIRGLKVSAGKKLQMLAVVAALSVVTLGVELAIH